MPKFDISVSHSLSQDEAVKRIREGVLVLKKQYADKISDLKENWEDNTCKFSLTAEGFTIEGVLSVKESDIEIAANLPFMAMLFKSQIETAVKEKLNGFLIDD